MFSKVLKAPLEIIVEDLRELKEELKEIKGVKGGVKRDKGRVDCKK